MDWNQTMNRMLPPQGGVNAHVTSGWLRSDGSFHGAVDFNYEGGQSGINLQHPGVHAPIDGTVERSSGGSYGQFEIRDDQGNLHRILHLESREPIAPGTRIHAGDPIGTMGDTNPDGKGAQHVHYEIKDAAGKLVDPQEFWKNKERTAEIGQGQAGGLERAVAEVQRRGAGPVAFVSADWEQQARVRALTGEQLCGIAAQSHAAVPGGQAPAYVVTEAGAIRNVVTGRDEYLAVRPGDGSPPALREAASRALSPAPSPELGPPAPAAPTVSAPSN